MEAAGLAIGVIGLAGLFSSCLETVEKAQSYFSFGVDSHVLDTRFKATKVRLEKWGQLSGLRDNTKSPHPALSQHEISSAVEDILQIINTVCGVNAISPIHDASLGPPKLQSLQVKRRRKLTWALGGKAKRIDQVQLFETLVQQLHNLVPPEEPEGSHASPAELRQIVARIEEMGRAETQREICAWLGGSPRNDRYHDSIQKRLEGTCDWIFDRPQFQNWLDPNFSSGAKVLWINGPAGFGKTILCSRIVEHLSSTFNTPLGHLFFSSELENREDPFFAIKFWILQIMLQNQVAFSYVRRFWEQDSDQVLTRLSSIKLLTQILHIVPNCTFIADGLDECLHLENHDSSVERFLRAVTDAISETKTRILVVSRDEPQIRYAFHEAHGSFFEYKISPDDVRSDTAVYSQEIVNRKLSNKSDLVRSDLSSVMTDRCEGQFLWLKIQEESLRRGMSQKQLRNVVGRTPTGLEAVYARNWARITHSPDRERTFALLRWAAFTLRPLTINEITEAVLIDESEEDLLIDDLPDAVDADYIDSEILGLCGPLLEIKSHEQNQLDGEKTVHLTHFSVRQFLLSSLPVPDCISGNERLRSEYQNTILAKACVHYINISRVWVGPLNHTSCLGTAFRDYAAGMWHRHFKTGLQNDEETLALVVNSLEQSGLARDAWCQWSNQEDPELAGRIRKHISSPLYYAVKLDLPNVVKTMITERGHDAGAADDDKQTPLELACTLGNEGVLKVLLDANVHISTPGKNGWTPLHRAAVNGHFVIAKMLLENGASVMEVTLQGMTPLCYASVCGMVEMAKFLINKGADVEHKSAMGSTPLILAIRRGYKDMAKLLISKGADLNARDDYGMTALHAAVSFRRSTEIAQTLGGELPLCAAWGKTQIELVKLLLEKGGDADIAANGGMTPLCLASERGQAELVKILLRSTNVGVASEALGGITPLILASRIGASRTVQELLADGRIDPRAADWHGTTALFAAVRNGHHEVVELLLKARCTSLEDRDGFGRTLFWWARRHGYDRVLELLLDHAEQTGSPVPDDTPPADVPSVPFNYFLSYCDACMLSIPSGEERTCKACDSGFCLCTSCAEVVRYECRDSNHVLLAPQSQGGHQN